MAESGPTPESSKPNGPPTKPSWSDRFFGLTPARRGRAVDDANDKRREQHSMAGAGLEMAAGIGLFAGIGYGIDRWLGSLPWGTVVGALLGMTAGMYLLIKAAQRQGGGK
ncbi:MAG: AtpZ/AtpI family protein [Planctomycetota bacterium]